MDNDAPCQLNAAERLHIDAATKRAKVELRARLTSAIRDPANRIPPVFRKPDHQQEWFEALVGCAVKVFDVWADVLSHHFLSQHFDSSDRYVRYLTEVVVPEVLSLVEGPNGFWPSILVQTAEVHGYAVHDYNLGPLADYIRPRLAARIEEWDARYAEMLVLRSAVPSGHETVLVQPSARKAKSWDAISIRFLSDFAVQISIDSERQEARTYEELGFIDWRGGKVKPNAAWRMLIAVARLNGVFHPAPHSNAKTQKYFQTLRKRLKDLVGLADDPLPYVEGVGYRAAFRIEKADAFDSAD